jgi:hypothetical protein
LLPLVVLVVLGAITSCIIAEPPSDLPRLPIARPTIVRGSVVPAPSNVIGRFPDKFIVPVELFDPTATFFWAAWVDFNPATGEGLQFFEKSEFAQVNTTGRVRTLEITLPSPTEDRCHVIEIVVGLSFEGQSGTGAHAPLDPGGDSVAWFYNPSGDLEGCPMLDAGIEASAPATDGGGDGGDGGIP